MRGLQTERQVIIVMMIIIGVSRKSVRPLFFRVHGGKKGDLLGKIVSQEILTKVKFRNVDKNVFSHPN